VVVHDTTSPVEVKGINLVISVTRLLGEQMFPTLTAMTRVVEEKSVVRLGVPDKRMNLPDYIILVRYMCSILRFLGKHDDIFRLVTIVVCQ